MILNFGNAIILLLINNGIMLAILVYLSQKFLDHRLTKDLKQHELNLGSMHKIMEEQMKHNFEKETKNLHELWELIEDVVQQCGAYDATQTCNKNLEQCIEALERKLSALEPFIEESIVFHVKELIEKASIDCFTQDRYLEVKKLRETIMSSYRVRLHLKQKGR